MPTKAKKSTQRKAQSKPPKQTRFCAYGDDQISVRKPKK